MRTETDWSKHEVTVERSENLIIHTLKEPNTILGMVKFINTCGRLMVVGDYGNYIFCRRFLPTQDMTVSDSYWCEKLKINSMQDPYKFDNHATERMLQDGLEFELNAEGFKGEELAQMEKYYNDLLNYVNYDEWEYVGHAYDTDKPLWLDTENVPFCRKIKYRLLIVFDAFEELCRRMTAFTAVLLEKPKSYISRNMKVGEEYQILEHSDTMIKLDIDGEETWFAKSRFKI